MAVRFFYTANEMGREVGRSPSASRQWMLSLPKPDAVIPAGSSETPAWTLETWRKFAESRTELRKNGALKVDMLEAIQRLEEREQDRIVAYKTEWPVMRPLPNKLARGGKPKAKKDDPGATGESSEARPFEDRLTRKSKSKDQ